MNSRAAAGSCSTSIAFPLSASPSNAAQTFIFLRADESPKVKGLAWTLLTFVVGWSGIPWGPIYTVQSLWVNLRGGHDLTAQAATALQLPFDKSMLYPEARKDLSYGPKARQTRLTRSNPPY